MTATEGYGRCTLLNFGVLLVLRRLRHLQWQGSTLAASRPSKRGSARPETSAFMRATLRVLAPHSLRQHGLERVVAAPEMVVERRRGMKRYQAEKKKPDRLVHLQELCRQWAVPVDQRRQLAEEEQ